MFSDALLIIIMCTISDILDITIKVNETLLSEN